MKKVFLSSAMAVAAAALTLGCSSQKNDSIRDNSVLPESVEMKPNVLGSEPRGVVLKATAFKMSGDYAGHVAVTLDQCGDLVYFPAPTDLSDASAPVEIGNGWWLNRQGLGPNSVFTKWTFSEYRAMKSVPSPAEIKAAIIPGASVTEFRQLPISASEANAETPSSLLRFL